MLKRIVTCLMCLCVSIVMVVLGIQATEVDMNAHHKDVTGVHPEEEGAHPGLYLPSPSLSYLLQSPVHVCILVLAQDVIVSFSIMLYETMRTLCS